MKNLSLQSKQTAMEKNPYIELAECVLPEEMIEYFEVVKVGRLDIWGDGLRVIS